VMVAVRPVIGSKIAKPRQSTIIGLYTTKDDVVNMSPPVRQVPLLIILQRGPTQQ
jgi:hypothetical protein